jgi:hypothetical protein
MARPTLASVKAANPQFFSPRDERLFGNQYTLKGHTLTVHDQRETSTGRIVEETFDYAIDPETQYLMPISIDRGNGKPYVFIQPDNTGPVLTQYLTTDGSPDGPPTPDMPNQHERKAR